MFTARAHQFCGFLVRQNRDAAFFKCGIAKQEFLNCVGKNHQHHRLIGDSGDGCQHPPPVRGGNAGIDHDHSRGTHQESAVADKSPVLLRDFGVDAYKRIDVFRDPRRFNG